MKKTMKAITINQYGGPEELTCQDVPIPQPGIDEVLVKVHAAGVNPIDWKIREGYMKEHIKQTFPLTLGWDFSGVVEETGEEVTQFTRGDEVYGRPDTSRNGAYAEYMVVRSSEMSIRPKSVDHIHSAAIPLAALTAWQSIFDVADLSSGQKILIHGAAGGVGHFAVQLAKWKGCYVIGTSSKFNQGFLHELGADLTIDYQNSRFEDIAHSCDVVLDTIGGETQKRSWQVLRNGGILVSIVSPPSANEASMHGVRQAMTGVCPNSKQLAEIAKLTDSGNIRPLVDNVFPLSEARRAHEFSQSGHTRGKLVLRIV
ncbi:MAG: NADP-dependent oxidoreductase [Pseudomonadota bacterium]